MAEDKVYMWCNRFGNHRLVLREYFMCEEKRVRAQCASFDNSPFHGIYYISLVYTL